MSDDATHLPAPVDGPTTTGPGRMTDLAGKVALITGSSRGIGAATATLFARHGAHVILHGRDTDALDRLRAGLEADGHHVSAVTADLTHFEDIEAMRERAEELAGTLDILVANAGGSSARPGQLEELSVDDWKHALDTNLTATFLTLKSFLPGMKRRGHGSIVTMSSAAARRPHPSSPIAYAAAKAGIELLTKDAALQAGPYGVRVNCIAPETILTETNQSRIPADVQAHLAASHPIRRLGTPDDIAHAALFLASEQSAWVTGVVLDVAGGSVIA